MDKSMFNYYLPPELIAQTPIRPRDHSRLMCLNRLTGEIVNRYFYDILDELNSNSLLVVNNSKVIPARLLGNISKTTIAAEVLLLRAIETDVYECIVKPGKKIWKNTIIDIDESLSLTIVDVLSNGNRIVKINHPTDTDIDDLLEKYGQVPLPPYITSQIQDSNDYQTVYASLPGSAAAPTAGFHFTSELIDRLKDKGIDIACVTLHIGLATFRPVREAQIENHHMHTEYYHIQEEEAEKINKAKVEGKKIVAVGTTSVRTLESACIDNRVVAGYGSTEIFIYPPYDFKMVDALITNFHLPESTLIMLVSAFAGYENTMKAYSVAVNEGYRFYSFGDAMYIS